jgi:HlyD family secretion protein
MKSMTPALQNALKFVQKNGLQIAAVLALLLSAAWGFQHWWRGSAVATLTIAQQDFVQTVVASGHVENPHRVNLGAQLSGTVKRVPVTEGQSVQAGQVLIELEDKELQAALRQAEFNVQQAQARVRQLNEVQLPMLDQSLRQSKVTQNTSQNALLRAQELFDKGFTGQAALDEAKRIAQVHQSQVLSFQEQLQSLQSGGSDLALSQAALSQAIAGAELARARHQYAQIKAPVAGVLISRNVEPGDAIQPGKILMVLSPEGSTELVVQIDEKHLSQLQIGQMAQASADAYSTQKFPAVLTYINPGIDPQRGSVAVKLKVSQAPDYLQQDMTVSVNIVVAKRSQAILVATEAVHDLEKKPWVMQLVMGRALRKDVQLGLHGAEFSEVLAGLKPGDVVIRNTTGISENARVRSQSVIPPQ